jgi:peptidoglycan/xylan/chitin deacetylase (PgdA/CDA1 family)
MDRTRRTLIAAAGAATAKLLWPRTPAGAEPATDKKRHLVTLSFDDGFKKSSIKTAEIYEKHGLSACINVIATGHRKDFVAPDQYQTGIPKGDFGLWNELHARGHEVMPHGYKHANKEKLPLAEAQDLIRRCLEMFSQELKGFDPRRAVFNFPYNASTPELEKWLTTQVRAFRARPKALNPLPYKGQVKLTALGFGPGNCEQAIDRELQNLLAKESGWLIFNTHGLEDEGWGPIRASYLERLLERLLAIDSVDVLPAGRALEKYAPPISSG